MSRLYLIPDNVKALKLLYLSDLYLKMIGKSIRVDSIIFFVVIFSRNVYYKCLSPNTRDGVNLKSVYLPILKLDTIPRLKPS